MQFSEILKRNRDALVASKKDFKAIFEISFSLSHCVLWEEDTPNGIVKHTYGEARETILRAATALKERLGCKGCYVALEAENSFLWIVGFWAILISGNKPYLVNTRYPASLLEGIANSLNIKFVLCVGDSHLNCEKIQIADLKSDTPCDLDLMADEIAFSSSATSMNEVICFYSGKQVAEQILNFEEIVKQCPQIVKHYKGQLKHLAFLPFYHIFGLFAVYFWFTFFGRTLVFLTDYSAEAVLQTCRRHKITHLFAVPKLWHTIERALNQRFKDKKWFFRLVGLSTAMQNVLPCTTPLMRRLFGFVNGRLFGSSMTFCISGGSYLKGSAAKLINGLGYSLHNGYGMSEIGIAAVDLRMKPKCLNEASIGRPFKSVEFDIRDGGLWVKGSSLCSKKSVNGLLTEVDGWFYTEDNVTKKDGYYHLLGRTSDIVIGDNGENINPDYIEQQFCIDEPFAVLGLRGDRGEELAMLVQAEPCRLDEIKRRLLEQNALLPPIMAVRRFYFTTQSIDAEGKIKSSRRQLASRIEKGELNITEF